jgi:hypothetical protein
LRAHAGSLDAVADGRGLGPLRVAGDVATVGYVGGLVIMLRRATGRVEAKGSL